jgi:hypothetical protein
LFHGNHGLRLEDLIEIGKAPPAAEERRRSKKKRVLETPEAEAPEA